LFFPHGKQGSQKKSNKLKRDSKINKGGKEGMPGRGAYGSSALTPPQIISRGELFLHTLGLSEGGGELLGGNYY
jgi:hypothetical protein